MIKTLRTGGVLLGAVLALIVVAPRAAQAQATENSSEPRSSEAQDQENYTYLTPEGCSLSLLSRRSLQLYDESKDDIALSKAATIYAETNIVQAMGPRLLDVGEEVEIPYALVDRYANSSQDLSARIIALWERYAARARFNLDDIKTVAQAKAERNVGKEADAINDSAESSDDKAARADADEAAESSPERGNNLWWAVVVGAVLYGAWMVSNRRRQAADE